MTVLYEGSKFRIEIDEHERLTVTDRLTGSEVQLAAASGGITVMAQGKGRLSKAYLDEEPPVLLVTHLPEGYSFAGRTI